MILSARTYRRKSSLSLRADDVSEHDRHLWPCSLHAGHELSDVDAQLQVRLATAIAIAIITTTIITIAIIICMINMIKLINMATVIIFGIVVVIGIVIVVVFALFFSIVVPFVLPCSRREHRPTTPDNQCTSQRWLF